MTVGETHTRTLAKTVAYRIASILLTMAITGLIGGDQGDMAKMGLAALILGSMSYYLHDRVWLLFGWNRDNQGFDSNKRSIVKTIVYRIIVLIMTFATAKLVLTENSNQTAATFAIVMMIANAIMYFVFEKISNVIGWGKKLPVEEPINE
jgi:uncharacterized membrane protein